MYILDNSGYTELNCIHIRKIKLGFGMNGFFSFKSLNVYSQKRNIFKKYVFIPIFIEIHSFMRSYDKKASLNDFKEAFYINLFLKRFKA